MSSPGVEPGLRPSQGRVRIRHTPRTYCDQPIPRPGVEPGLAASKAAVPIRHTRGEKMGCPRQESNLVLDLRRVACAPAHSGGGSTSCLETRAGARGFEPRTSGLEPESSPRRTPLSIDPNPFRGCPTGVEPAPRDPQSRVLPLHHGHHLASRTSSSGSGRGGGRTRKACARPPSKRVPSPSSGGPSLCHAPARIRTRKTSLEARHDLRFITGANEPKSRPGIEPGTSR